MCHLQSLSHAKIKNCYSVAVVQAQSSASTPTPATKVSCRAQGLWLLLHTTVLSLVSSQKPGPKEQAHCRLPPTQLSGTTGHQGNLQRLLSSQTRLSL